MALKTIRIMNQTTGALPTIDAAATSDTFAAPSSTGTDFAVYRNTGTAKIVTVTLPASVVDEFGRDLADLLGTAANLAATTGELWIPLHPSMQATTGLITITVDSATAVTNAHVRIA
jgi:hypothetical protein